MRSAPTTACIEFFEGWLVPQQKHMVYIYHQVAYLPSVLEMLEMLVNVGILYQQPQNV